MLCIVSSFLQTVGGSGVLPFSECLLSADPSNSNSLSDVSSNASVATFENEFRRSRWWMRGWTLQELLAPTKVVFFTDTSEIPATDLPMGGSYIHGDQQAQ